MVKVALELPTTEELEEDVEVAVGPLVELEVADVEEVARETVLRVARSVDVLRLARLRAVSVVEVRFE